MIRADWDPDGGVKASLHGYALWLARAEAHELLAALKALLRADDAGVTPPRALAPRRRTRHESQTKESNAALKSQRRLSPEAKGSEALGRTKSHTKGAPPQTRPRIACPS